MRPKEWAKRHGWAGTLRFWIFLVFMLLVFLGGGGSRSDILSLLYVRPAVLVCLLVILTLPGPIDLRTVRIPLVLLGAWALLMVVHLIPLPPSIWTLLPGQAMFDPSQALGVPQFNRPISVSPDRTLNSLVALGVPLTALIGMAALRTDQARWLLLPLLIAALLSALLATVQLSAGGSARFYLYAVTNEGSAVGLFANRNHQAVLLAAAFPLLAVWATEGGSDEQISPVRRGVAVSVGLFLMLMIVVTGSRAGLVLGSVGLLTSYLFWRISSRSSSRKKKGWLALLLKVGPWVAAALILIAAIMLSRAEAIQRLLGTGTAADLRLFNFPLLFELAGKFMPLGSGFGTFDPVYRVFEPHQSLNLRYLNHAHNDLLEVAITAGAAGLLIVAVFLVWWLGRAVAAVLQLWRHKQRGVMFEALGAAIMLLLLMASLVDYPLRTPAHAMVFAIACGWLCGLARRNRDLGQPGREGSSLSGFTRPTSGVKQTSAIRPARP